MSANIFAKAFIHFMVFLTLSPACAPGASPVAHVKQKTLGVWTHAVVVDLNDPSVEVNVALSRGGIRTSESFASMINRTRALAAITGTFFCTRSLIPIGDIVTGGRVVNRGPIGACVAFTPDNHVKISAGGRNVHPDWTGFSAGMRSGPQLISGGKISIHAKQEGFRERSLFGRRIRTAVGVTAHNKLLLVAVKTPVTFSELAKVMRRMGAVEAVNLDGGSSTALSIRGKILMHPGRRLTNLIVVNRRRPMLDVPGKPLPPAPRPAVVAIVPGATPPQQDVTLVELPEQNATLPERISAMSVER